MAIRFRPVLEVLLLFGFAVLFIYLVLPLADGNMVRTQAMLWTANIVMIGLVWLSLRTRKMAWKDIGLVFAFRGWKDFRQVLLKSLIVFLVGMLGFLLGSVIMVNISGIPEPADMSGYSFLSDHIIWLVLMLIGVWTSSAIGEEIIYRGYLINRLADVFPSTRYKDTIAVLGSAVIFGLAHYQWGTTGIVQTALMGLAIGICYLKMGRRLLIMILAHAYMDTILIVQIFLGS